MSFNVKTYGAVGNAKYVADGTTVMGSNVIQSTQAQFVPGDVGATIWCIDNPDVPLTGQTVITGYVSPTQITVATPLIRSGTGIQITWGTDDTAAFLAAYAASRTDPSITVYPNLGSFGTVFIPTGGYILTGKFYKTTGTTSFSLVGEDKSNTLLYPSPDCPAPVDFTPVWIEVLGATGSMKGFSIIGPNYNYTMQGSGQSLIRVAQSKDCEIDINVTRIGAGPTSFFNYGVSIEFSKITGSLLVQNEGQILVHGGNNFMVGLKLLGAYGSLYGLISNFYRNVEIDSCVSRQGVGNPAVGTQIMCLSGLVDEQTGPDSVIVVNNSNVNFNSLTVWASGENAINVDATSKVYLDSCDAGSYFLENGGTKAVTIAPGGVVVASESTFRAISATSTVSIVNDGTFMDAGGNNALNGGTGSNVDVPWLQAFKNPAQILRR